MPDLYQSNYRLLLELLPDLPQLGAGDYRRLTSPGFMDLSVDVLHRNANHLGLALAHNYKLNGDLVPDPDMELRVDLSTTTAEALTYQDAHRYQVVYPQPGKVRPHLRSSLNVFLATWLQNLLAQGHKPTP